MYGDRELPHAPDTEPPPEDPAGWRPATTPGAAPRLASGEALAGLGDRVGGAFIDVGVCAVVMVVVAALVGSSLNGTKIDELTSISLRTAVLAALAQAVLLLPLAYLAVGWHRGETLGSRQRGLAVVDLGGGPPSWAQCVQRACIANAPLLAAPVVGAFAGVGPGLGLIVVGPVATLWWAARDPWRRGWHDIVAGTAVVTRRPGFWWLQPPPSPGVTPAAPCPAMPPEAPPAATRERGRVPWTWTDVLPVLVLYYPMGLGVSIVFRSVIHLVHTGALTGGAVPLANTLLDISVDGADLGLLYLLVRVRRGRRMADVGWRRTDWRWLVTGVVLGLVTLRVEGILGPISDALFPHTAPQQCKDIRSEFSAFLPLAILAVAAIAPLFEETIFRGFTYTWLRGRLPASAAIVVSAVLFSAAHFAYFQPTVFLPIFGAGLVLAATMELSGSIWPGVMVHATLNLVVTLSLFSQSTC